MFGLLPVACLLLLDCLLASTVPSSAERGTVNMPGALLRGNAVVKYVIWSLVSAKSPVN